ncbi:NAD-dependent epimerase/dehydratase family protein [Phreatobacter sp.]|uniref:NAD-dependent epimerase/dehydratase family protein n=1 Tax=Phreatobacter sp. TaxID=1966341 RepID=UPI0022CBB3AD|nr:NAD-dependent epimerase/dehydratase family protein [Phreatobacter sp.]MCZ8316885.1 NAD-dependent epimerase/dehydratase family protein [Phreatobacter sp.]
MNNAAPSGRILITGGSGFLGRAFIAAMGAEGREVISIGRSPAPGARHAPADLADPASLRAALASLRNEPAPDAIVHLAVSRHHRDFPAKALDLFHVNASTAAELLDFGCARGVRQVVFGSTGTVYGAGVTSPEKASLRASEDTFQRPSSYFAASKLFADTMAELYRGYMSVAVLRFYAPYGPGLRNRMLADLVERVREGRPLSLPSSGGGLTFSAIHIDDAVAVLRAALDLGWRDTVNVASPEVWSIESAGHLIGRLVGTEAKFERDSNTLALRLVPAVDLLQTLMPGRDWIRLEDGLAGMIAGL